MPVSLDCTRSAHTVEIAEAATEVLYCPEYFSNRTCCLEEEMTAVWEKVEDMLRFITRVLSDQKEELLPEGTEAFEGDPCAEYHARLFTSRSAAYRRARQAVEKGADILQGAGLHFLCGACFACVNPMKIAQIDDFVRRALLSVQDAMGAILEEQRTADRPPHPACSSRYVESLSAGVPFPAWGRFSPEIDVGGGGGLSGGGWRPQRALSSMLAVWLDRVLSLLLELPTALLFQQTLLQLSLFYLERPESDAHALLHGVGADDGAEQPIMGAGGAAPDVCPLGPRRLLALVPQDLPEESLGRWRASLEAAAAGWGVLWVVTSPAHVRAMRHGPSLLWRRFEVRDLDAFAAAICGERGAFVLRLPGGAEAGAQESDVVAALLHRLAAAEGEVDAAVAERVESNRGELLDMLPLTSGGGLRPAAPQLAPQPWPSEAFSRYLRAHSEFREALLEGRQLPDSRVLIYACTSMTFCGGHGDRLNGMLSAAVVALLSGRLFFVDSQRPVPLSLVLEPNRWDWQLHGTIAALPAGINLNDKLATFEADPRWLLDNQASVLRLVSNQRLTSAALLAAPRQAEAFGLASQPKLHAQLFHELFRPSAAFRHRLAKRGLPSTGRLIGVHFRAGDQMPAHWKDPPRHGLAELDEFLDCAEQLEASLGWDDARVVLFADTNLVLDLPRVQALVESGKVVWPAQTDSLIHLDRSPATLAVRGLLSVWADWWTLAFDVHALVLCHSGFGATALEIGPPRPAVLGKGCVPADGGTG